MGNKGGKFCETICIGEVVYGTEKSPFWENEELISFLKTGDNAQTHFFRAMALCNEYSVEDRLGGAKVNHMNLVEERCYLATEKIGMKLAKIDGEKKGVKVIEYDQEIYPEKGKESWSTLYVIGKIARRGRITVVLSKIDEEMKPTGDILVYSTGKRKDLLQIVDMETCEPWLKKTSGYFQELTRENQKKKKPLNLRHCYFAYRTIEREEWEKLEKEFNGDGKEPARSSQVVKFHNEIEGNLLLLGGIGVNENLK